MNKEDQEKKPTPPAKTHVRMKLFPFTMLIFGLVIVTAIVTFFALTMGEDKVVDVVSPQTDRQEFKKIYDVYDELQANYFSEFKEEDLIEGAVNGMVDALDDPYTDYLSKEESKQLTESISSSFEGIGAEIRESDNYIRIVSPIKNSPAEKAGLLPNDLVLTVDGQSIQGMTSSEAVMLIRGEKGSKVTLEIKRGDEEPFKVDITRDVIPIETVYAEKLNERIGHIQITSFADDTYNELVQAIQQFEKDGMEGLVIDLRQNPGGRLDTALDISDLFIPEGKGIMQYEDKNGKTQLYTASSGDKIAVPLAFLIDDGSASASEILAGAIKESTDIPVVGLTSFGKGTVQTPKELKDGSTLKMTTANWLTPSGKHIHEQGIEPDYVVEYPPYASLPFLNPETPMKEGDVSAQVKVAQQMLEVTGYLQATPDGAYGAQTVQAVQALQREKQLPVDGILQNETTFALMDALRETLKENDPQMQKAQQLVEEQLQKK